MGTIDTVCIKVDNLSCSAALSETRKVCLLVQVNIHLALFCTVMTMMSDPTPVSPACAQRFESIGSRMILMLAVVLEPRLQYVLQISFMPLNLLNVYPMNGSAMSADC